MIPIEFEPYIRPSSTSHKENLQTTAKNAGKDDGTDPVSEISEQEIVIDREFHGVKGKMEGKTHGQVEKVPWTKEDDEVKRTEHKKANDEFLDYIDHVKNKMGIVSNVGGGGIERTATRRDSFNDKVSSYIKRAQMKIRTTTNFDGKSSTFK